MTPVNSTVIFFLFLPTPYDGHITQKTLAGLLRCQRFMVYPIHEYLVLIWQHIEPMMPEIHT